MPPKNATATRPDLPPLAQYRSISDYAPHYGDHVVWSGWFTTWCGVVTNFDEDTDTIDIIFAGIPFLLFTMSVHEQEKETKQIKLSRIRSSTHGTFAVMQHDFTRNSNIWFI